jgi:hypothetical protein
MPRVETIGELRRAIHGLPDDFGIEAHNEGEPFKYLHVEAANKRAYFGDNAPAGEDPDCIIIECSDD